MKILKKMIVFAMAISFSARADVAGEMNAWFSDLGAMSNLTPGQVIQGQTSTTYFGGSMHLRTPRKNYNLASLQLPNVRAGCGGIDLFAGSFSFINSENLTAMLRNVANNAVGYAFMMSIRAISPETADLMQYLQDAASKINNMNVNSCQMAEGLVYATGSALSEKFAERNVKSASALTNAYNDSIGGVIEWGKGLANRVSVLDKINESAPDLGKEMGAQNIVWEALSLTDAPTEMRELMMSMVGTVIIKPMKQGQENYETEYYYPIDSIDFNKFIGTTNSTLPEIDIHRCADANGGCLNIIPGRITNLRSFKSSVYLAIVAAKNAIQSRTAIDFNQNPLASYIYSNTSFPVWRIVNIAAGSSNSLVLDLYVDVIALELASAWFRDIIHNINRALYKTQKKNNPQIKAELTRLISNVQKKEESLNALKAVEYGKLQGVVQLQQQVQWMHQNMMRSMPAEIQKSVRMFAK